MEHSETRVHAGSYRGGGRGVGTRTSTSLAAHFIAAKGGSLHLNAKYKAACPWDASAEDGARPSHAAGLPAPRSEGIEEAHAGSTAPVAEGDAHPQPVRNLIVAERETPAEVRRANATARLSAQFSMTATPQQLDEQEYAAARVLESRSPPLKS